jgi:cell division transport system permease protein
MRLRLLVSEAWRSLGANVSTTFAAMMTILIGMFLLGLTIAISSWTISYANHIKSELQVRVDMNSSEDKAGQATISQENAVARRLEHDPLVAKFTFVPKAVGLAQMKRSDPGIANTLPFNPLPDVFIVVPKNADDVLKLATQLQSPLPSGVHQIIDEKVDSKRILHWAKIVEIIFSVAIVILLCSAALLIANTIRLSIFSRRREIEVMKLVGATNWFVRGPFMIEGLLCGVGGSVLAVILLGVGKEFALPALLSNWLNTPDVHALSFPLNALILLAIGLVLGAVGSGVTVRRFLQI